ncbi:MAG TPA: sulfur transferase domain-containing protein [Gemmatimonadaceae bacterium]
MMRRFHSTALLVALVLATRGADAQLLVGKESIKALPAPVLLETTGMFQDKYAKVGDDLFIAGQPTEKALREMKALGVTTVVNLRSPSEMARIGFDEAKLITDLGMKYVYIPVRGDAEFPYSPAALAKFTEVMQSNQGKVLLHCTVAWRASHLWGAYLIQQGVPAADALTHARAINLMDNHRMDSSGRQPIELFLGRAIPGVGKP